MTSRSRPGSSRTRIWDDPTRRNMLYNIGFGLAIVAALLTMLVAGGVAYYEGHWAPAITVNNVTLNQDDIARENKINTWLINYQLTRTRTLETQGHLWATDATNRESALANEATDPTSLSVNQLTEGTVMVDLAQKNGQAVTAADIAAKERDTATQPELRHVWMIVVAPTKASGENNPTQAEDSAAQAKATAALNEIKGGADWATVAKATSTDTATAPNGGDLGWIDKNSSLDSGFVEALMAAPLNTPTDVITGADGSYYFGKVTETIAASTDPNFASSAQQAGISQSDLDWSFQFAAASSKLQDWATAQAMVSAPQRHVYRIYLKNSPSETGTSAVAVRHILFSPNHDPNNASSVAATDPAWAEAKSRADAAYAQLQADPTQFDALARSESDDSNSAPDGGKLGYISKEDQVVQPFADAIFKAGLQPGQILPPVKTDYGYHIIQIMHFPTDLQWANKLVAQSTSLDAFQALARDNSDDPEATKGGDMGWIGTHTDQVSDTLATAIFAAPVGKVSTVTQVTGDGTYIFWVAAEQTKVPDGAQAASIKANYFNTWYSGQRANYTIWQDPSLTASSTSE